MQNGHMNKYLQYQAIRESNFSTRLYDDEIDVFDKNDN